MLILMLAQHFHDFLKDKLIMRKSCVVFCLVFGVLSVSSEKRSSVRFYANGTNTTCLGIVCPRNFIFVPCTLGDGRKDTCVPCPLDRPISVDKFNSAYFTDPPDNICKDPDERCVCTYEAKLVNPGECYNNLNPKCECDVSRGYFGSDPKLCKLSDNHCSSTGFELALNGSCLKCSDDTYKDQIGYGKCKQQPKCNHPYAVDQPGDFRTKRTCKLQTTVTTPFPGKTTTVLNSMSTTVNGYTIIQTSSASVNETATINPPGKEPTSEETRIILIVIPGFIVITVIVGVIYFKVCRNRREDDCEDVTVVLCNRCGHKNYNQIELNDIEQFIDGGKDKDKNNKETDELLQDSTQNLDETRDTDDLSTERAKPFITASNGDRDILHTGRTSESDNSLIGAGNNNISDISTCGPRSIPEESCQASGSGGKSGNTKNGSGETLPKAIHRQPEIQLNSSKNVESVVKNENTNPAAVKIETVASETTSVQSVDNVLNNLEEYVGTGQLPHSPDNATRFKRSHEADQKSVDNVSKDTELKKEASSDDTIVKASEQNSTLSPTPSLRVDSMLSGGNTNSSGPSYMYLLRWETSGDDRPRRGKIEYWENQQYCLKSKVLTDLETGKVLLKSPKKYKNDNDVYFVPEKYNDGIQPFVQIKMEQLQDEIDIQSLLKSGATICDLDTFEITGIDQQRPEVNPAHSGQLLSEQLHHMPLPHEQNQSDSGIDNNTGNNEVQNDDQFNQLSLASFEDD